MGRCNPCAPTNCSRHRGSISHALVLRPPPTWCFSAPLLQTEKKEDESHLWSARMKYAPRNLMSARRWETHGIRDDHWPWLCRPFSSCPTNKMWGPVHLKLESLRLRVPKQVGIRASRAWRQGGSRGSAVRHSPPLPCEIPPCTCQRKSASSHRRSEGCKVEQKHTSLSQVRKICITLFSASRLRRCLVGRFLWIQQSFGVLEASRVGEI